MRKLTSTISILLAGAIVALALAGQGEARSAQSVRCSSATPPRDSLGRPIDLTGTWTANDGQPYYLRQIGSCLWWTGSKGGSNVLFGTVYGSTVVGEWADVRSRSARKSGSLTLLITAGNTILTLRTGTSTGALPARRWQKTR